MFDQWYSWRADEVTSIDRCYFGQSAPLNEFRAFDSNGGRGYDGAGQLRYNYSTTTGGGVSQAAREFRYDLRGNRISLAFGVVPPSGDVAGQVATYSYADDRLTRLAAARISSATASEVYGTKAIRTFSYDADHRIIAEASATDTSGAPNSTTSYTFPYSGGAERGGIDSVIRGVSMNGVVYNYYYDSQNRRTRKQYPLAGAVEDFFYADDGRLLSERSFTYATNDQGNTVDEYIWLAGMPVMMMRSLFDGSMLRAADWSGVPSNGSTVCPRRNEDASCATHFIVNDHVGRPVYVLSKDSGLEGVGEYDAFGEMNRVHVMAETSHPYGAGQNYNLVTQAGRDPLAYLLPMRARFSFVDTNNSYQCGFFVCSDSDRAEVRDGATVKATIKGQHAGPQATSWFSTSNNRFDVLWASDANGTLRDGVVFDGYEYQRVGSGVFRIFPPLRFPGQYFDEETGLHENWNRYYDPSIGRYLSPEPLLQSPGYMTTTAARGMQVPTYAYAANNPLRYVDIDGLRISATVVNDPYGWIPGCTAKPGGGKTCARVARDGAVGQCRPSPSGCGYGFDVSVNSYIASHYSPQTDPKGQSVGDPPGFTLENHEFGHRLDLQFDFAEPALNQSIQTEGFATQAECERARASFDANLNAYKVGSMLDSVMRRDRY